MKEEERSKDARYKSGDERREDIYGEEIRIFYGHDSHLALLY